MHCANCDAPALYIYGPKPLTPTAYCDKHLPGFLRKAAKSGVLPTTDAYDALRRETLNRLAPAPEPDPEPETTREDDPEPAPKPARKRAKKPPVTPEEAPDAPEEPSEA
jgi:hypothetical protein